MWKRPFDTFGRFLPKAVFFFSFFFLVLVHCFRFFFYNSTALFCLQALRRQPQVIWATGDLSRLDVMFLPLIFPTIAIVLHSRTSIKTLFIYLFILEISFFYFWYSRGYSVPFHTWYKKLNETFFFSLHKSEKIKYIYTYIYILVDTFSLFNTLHQCCAVPSLHWSRGFTSDGLPSFSNDVAIFPAQHGLIDSLFKH